jgi:hypothetical protein
MLRRGHQCEIVDTYRDDHIVNFCNKYLLLIEYMDELLSHCLVVLWTMEIPLLLFCLLVISFRPLVCPRYII